MFAWLFYIYPMHRSGAHNSHEGTATVTQNMAGLFVRVRLEDRWKGRCDRNEVGFWGWWWSERPPVYRGSSKSLVGMRSCGMGRIDKWKLKIREECKLWVKEYFWLIFVYCSLDRGNKLPECWFKDYHIAYVTAF